MRRTLLTALMLLAGCAGSGGDRPERGRLELLAPLTIPPAEASVRLQNGYPVARNAVREYDPFCVLEIDTVADIPQTVRPDNFRITRMAETIDTIAALPQPRLMKVGLFDDDRPSHIYYKTHFTLHSDRQPGVRSLTCLINQNMPGVYPFMRFLKIDEMRTALGTAFRLEPR